MADLLENYRTEYLRLHSNRFHHFVSWGRSPIESIMIAYMLADGWGHPSQRDWAFFREACGEIDVEPTGFMLHSCTELFFVMIDAPVTCGKYRLTPDFLLVNPYGKKVRAVAVELDGHDFHERTKEQATRDKKRDRSLLAKGLPVARFTGSEVVRDPAAVFATWQELAGGIK